MSAVASQAPTPPAPRPWERLHRALMPDYNRKATIYWWTSVVLGAAVLLHSLLSVAALPWSSIGQVAVGIAIALLAGFFPVRIARSKSSFAAGEIFIFLLLLLQGPAAATLAAAAETSIGAVRSSKRWTSRIASPAFSALSMFAAGSVLHALLGALASRHLDSAAAVLAATMPFALLFFTLNTLLVSAVPRLKRDERLQLADWLSVFGWVGVAFTGSGAVAALLFLICRASGLGVLAAVVPILTMLLATLHFYNRHHEALVAAEQAAREAAERAAAREAEAAARHLRELEFSERRFHSAFTHASIGMALLSTDGRVRQANAAMRDLLGVEADRLEQHAFQDFVAEEDRVALAVQLARVSDPGFEAFAFELRCRHADGRIVWVATHCSPFSDADSATPCLIFQAHDITARREAESSLQRLAFHDSLTGLPNRHRFCELLAQAVAEAQSDRERRYSVMFLDFDRFKLINDSLGHNAGDEFLVKVAQRIRSVVRPADVVARLGGDEFAVLMYSGESAATGLAERLLQGLREPFQVAGTELTTSASIGITSGRFGYESPHDVLRDADIAMFKSKAAGKARYTLFDVALHGEMAHRLRLEIDLQHAAADGRLWVAYQPMYDLASGRLKGFEALARWNHPEQGPIAPERFIPIAEDSGQIVALTDFVLGAACRQLREWQALDPSLASLRMHVNVSAKDLSQPGLVARVTQALVAARLQPECLKLELSESILMERLEAALPVLTELCSLGVGLSVDDFGTGYSSLAHLSRLPIESLKVDRLFVRNVVSGTSDASVVRAIVQLGRSLGMEVIAEGIETESQFATLREMGCRLGQGYHLSRPIPAATAKALLEATLARRPVGWGTAALERPGILH
jgi:diguanylate cyclase (GGDEF)-like protein/PAS domain S-box-containing protein